MRSPEFPLLQDYQPHLPQQLLTGLVFQIPHQPCCLSLDSFQPLHVLPKLGSQNWTQHSRCCPTSAEHRGRITALVLLATPFLIHRSSRGWMREMLGMVCTKCYWLSVMKGLDFHIYSDCIWRCWGSIWIGRCWYESRNRKRQQDKTVLFALFSK